MGGIAVWVCLTGSLTIGKSCTGDGGFKGVSDQGGGSWSDGQSPICSKNQGMSENSCIIEGARLLDVIFKD